MAKSGVISGVAGVLVAGAAFVVLQKWMPPDFVLDLLDAKPERHPPAKDPRHTLALTPAQGGDALVTEADVVSARTRGSDGDGVAGVILDLGKAGRDRLAAFAADHAADPIAVSVDGAVVATRAASTFAETPGIDLEAKTPLERDSYELAGRFGGAPGTVDPYSLAAARLVPALLAGLIALFLVRIVTRGR